MRLEIHCQDRLGIAQEVLNILVSYRIDLRGIEVDPSLGRMFVAFPSVDFERFQELMAKIRRIPAGSGGACSTTSGISAGGSAARAVGPGTPGPSARATSETTAARVKARISEAPRSQLAPKG